MPGGTAEAWLAQAPEDVQQCVWDVVALVAVFTWRPGGGLGISDCKGLLFGVFLGKKLGFCVLSTSILADGVG